jgi:hypothetical protein
VFLTHTGTKGANRIPLKSLFCRLGSQLPPGD